MTSPISTRFLLVASKLCAVFMLLAGTVALWAQSGAGTIQGNVQDATTAALPGARP